MWLVVCMCAFVALVFWIANTVSKNDLQQRELEKEREALRKSFEVDKSDYIARTFESRTAKCGRGDYEAMIGVADGGLRIASWSKASDHFYNFELPERLHFTVANERFISFSEISEVSTIQDDVTETYTRMVSTPVAVAKKKSGIGRALVGGALLGPVGAVVGAASAASTSNKIQTIVTAQQDTRIVAGPPTLVLTLKSETYTFERIKFDSMDDARSWALWIKDNI